MQHYTSTFKVANYTQTASGVLNIKIGGSAAGTQFDQLQPSTLATLNGTLNLNLINGFQPAVSSSFQIISSNGGSVTGQFATVNGPFSAQYTSNSVTAIRVPTPPLIVVKAGRGSGTVTSDKGGIICGATCSDNYAAGTVVTLTATPAAGSQFTGWLGAQALGGDFAVPNKWNGVCTGTGTCQSDMRGQTAALATFSLNDIGVPSLDIDGSTHSEAMTDGLLVLWSMFGISGASLVSGAIATGATRTTAAQVVDYLTDIRPMLDVDGDGNTNALTDSLLVVRFLLGLRGNALMANAVNPLGTRPTSTAIETYLQGLFRP